MIESFSNLSRRLEDQFFFEQDRMMKEQLEKLRKEEESVEALSKVSGITDKAVLRELVAHNIRPETLAALCLTPIIEVVWADGKADEKEIEAVLRAAKKNGLAEDHLVLKEWLNKKPGPGFMNAWKHYMKGLAKEISAEAMAAMKKDILTHAKAVAEASGAFLGLVSPISAEEKKVLHGIEKFLKGL
jgi:hypothetical protein